MDALMGSSKSTTPPPSTNSVAAIAPSQPLHQQPPPQPMYHHPHPPPPPHIAHLQQQQPLHHPLMPSASHTTFQPSPSSTSSSSTPGNTSTPSLFQSIANPLAPSSSNTTALPTGSSPSLPSLSSQQNQPPTDASLASTFATSLLLSPPTTHSQLPPPSSTMDAFANGARRPSISTLNQLSFSDTTPQPPVAAPPGVSIPTHHNRRPSAMAGPIGSPVNSRFGAFDHFDTNSSNAANGLMQPDPSSSFFSNFLFGNQGIKPFNDQDLLGHSRLDVDRRFSMDSPFSNWRTNGGWPASTSLLADNVHGTQSRFDKTDRQAQVLDRAKVAYQKLDEITQAKYFLGGGSSSQYTMTQLHRMMSDLYCDTTVDSRELYEVLAQSAQFQCIQHPQQGVLVRYDAIPRAPAASSAANAAAPAPPGTQDDPLRRTSMLPPHNAPQPPPGHPPASALHHQTSSPPFSFQPSLSTSLNYSFKNDR
ncbi:hypothetical protein BC940DRAFT_310566 [Gongronella butleri]|nr:hypothetical protein BC940DRAFT_310566 [Gongronella butleri]